MATNNRLKAYVRFDGTGRVIPGSLILQRFKPKVGNWKEIPASECCNPTPNPLPSNCIEFVVNTTYDTYFDFTAQSFSQDFTYTITWGDGTTDTGSSGEGTAFLSHTYATPNREYTARICFSNAAIINQIDFPGFD